MELTEEAESTMTPEIRFNTAIAATNRVYVTFCFVPAVALLATRLRVKRLVGNAAVIA